MKNKNAALVLTGILLALLVLCPVAMVFFRAVMVNGRFDLSSAFLTIFRAENLRTIGNSLWLGLWVVIVSTSIAFPLAYLLSRTDLSRHHWLDVVLLIPFMTPPYICSMGWILFMQQRGLLQQTLPFASFLTPAFFSFGGIVFVMALNIFPFMYNILKNAMLNINSNLEEAGAVFGGGFLYRMRRIFVPLLSGNYVIGALLVFVKTLSEYGTPATLGKRIGYEVFTTQIHVSATTAPVDFGKAAALSSVLVSVCLIMWYLQNRVTDKASYNVVSGKGSRLAVRRLSPVGRCLAWGYILVVLLLSIGIPYFSVAITSLIKLRGYGLRAGNFTFANYVSLFTENPKGRNALWTSLTLACSSATIAAMLGTAFAIVAHKSRNRFGKVLESVSLLPEMVPNIVLVIGLMLFWNGIYRIVPLYNTLGMMILTYVVMFIPFTVQYVTSSLSQINDGLMQAGRVFGASPFYIFRKVTLPLVFNGILTGWIMTFIISFRELVASSLIAPPGVLTVSMFILREFEQGSVSVGMCMAMLCVLFTTFVLLVMNRFTGRSKTKPVSRARGRAAEDTATENRSEPGASERTGLRSKAGTPADAIVPDKARRLVGAGKPAGGGTSIETGTADVRG